MEGNFSESGKPLIDADRLAQILFMQDVLCERLNRIEGNLLHISASLQMLQRSFNEQDLLIKRILSGESKLVCSKQKGLFDEV